MIKVMLVEDEEVIRRLLKKMVEKVDGFQVIKEASNVSDAIDAYEEDPADVVFVDIDLGGESGLGLAKRISEQNPDVKIVFATAHSEYMADAFEIYAYDYLVKPFNVDRVIRTLTKIKDCTDPGESATQEKKSEPAIDIGQGKLAVKGREELVLIDVEDILMIERNQGATRIVTVEEELQTSMSLSDIEEKLPAKQFMRCHRSYIVNVAKIKKMTQYGRWTYTVYLKGSEETALMTHENYELIKNGY